jgi:PXPV repeat-containing protein
MVSLARPSKEVEEREEDIMRGIVGSVGRAVLLAGVMVAGLSGCVVAGPPAYVAPAYVAPAPVYVAPAPVYVAPAPVVVWGGYGWHRRWR